jgi:stage II sporulation protein D
MNRLRVEDYLRGVVNSEVSSVWSEDALAAQIIAARTYALYQITLAAAKGASFDLDADVKDQVYEGSERETSRSSKIVDQTRGVVLTSDRGVHFSPIKAFYHSTCGGETELPERVWGKRVLGFQRKVVCSFCKNSPLYSWSTVLTSEEITSAILRGIQSEGLPRNWPKLPKGLLQAQNLREVRPLVNDGQQRLGDLMTVWQGSRSLFALRVDAARLREWVGFSRIKSTWFQVTPRLVLGGAQYWVFRGRGSGHGVGMCQWGMKEMGALGYKYASILHHYYPEAILRKLW